MAPSEVLYRNDIPLSADPQAARTPRMAKSAQQSTQKRLAEDRDRLREAAVAYYCGLSWSGWEADIAAEAAKLAIALDQAELIAHLEAGRKRILCYCERPEEFEIRWIRPGQREILLGGQAVGQVRLPGQFSTGHDDVMVRVLGMASAHVASGKATFEQGSRGRVTSSDLVTVRDHADITIASKAAKIDAYDHARLLLDKSGRVRASGDVSVLVDLDGSYGQLFLCGQAQLTDPTEASVIVTAQDLAEGENVPGNEMWLRRQELTCCYLQWVR
jgi:hypothetical protein